VLELFKGIKEGKNRVEALRQAQLEVQRNGQDRDGRPADYSAPFSWAGFIWIGEYL
jgi:CHAT domain-containing protein